MTLHSKAGEISGKTFHDEALQGDPRQSYNRGSLEKGLAVGGGCREEILRMPEIEASFLYPFSYGLAIQRFCYRGPKPQKCPKWLGEGAKGLLGQGRQSPLALVQKGSCTGAKQGFGGAKDSWETFAPWVQKTFCTLSEPLWALLRFRAPVAGTRGRNYGPLEEGRHITGELFGQFLGVVCCLSGPLDRLNAILSLLQPLDRYRALFAIGSAIGRALSQSPISHPRTGGSSQPPRSKPLGGLNRAIVAL